MKVWWSMAFGDVPRRLNAGDTWQREAMKLLGAVVSEERHFGTNWCFAVKAWWIRVLTL